jgi:hypothetical protein
MGSYEMESICRLMDISHRSRIRLDGSRKDLDDAFECKPTYPYQRSVPIPIFIPC